MFRSNDTFSWDYLSTVACASDFPKSGEGPNENSLALTSSGDLLTVMRFDANDGTRWGDHSEKNYFSSRSSDGGRTWTKASEMRDMSGKGIGTARPRLLLLGGSLLLTGSRVLSSHDSDYYLWHDGDGTGRSFDAHSLTYHHNQLVQNPKQRIGVWCNGTNVTAPGQACAGYTSVVPLDKHNALLMYSTDTVDDGEWIFSMRVALKSDDLLRPSFEVILIPDGAGNTSMYSTNYQSLGGGTLMGACGGELSITAGRSWHKGTDNICPYPLARSNTSAVRSVATDMLLPTDPTGKNPGPRSFAAGGFTTYGRTPDGVAIAHTAANITFAGLPYGAVASCSQHSCYCADFGDEYHYKDVPWGKYPADALHLFSAVRLPNGYMLATAVVCEKESVKK